MTCILSSSPVSFTEQLLDNNAPDFFYLHEDASLGMGAPCCAFLRPTLTLNIDVIGACQEAKAAQIKESFRAKLGWLAGNMYSRVGTEEWIRSHEEPVEKQAKSLLKGSLLNIDKRHIELRNLECRGEGKGE